MGNTKRKETIGCQYFETRTFTREKLGQSITEKIYGSRKRKKQGKNEEKEKKKVRVNISIFVVATIFHFDYVIFNGQKERFLIIYEIEMVLFSILLIINI